jgi:putative ATP-dependent endonuclease of OLD family
MRIVGIRFLHFRCLYSTGWIPIRELTVLIGENDCGKTAALDGIAILLGAGTGRVEDISFKAEPVVVDPETQEPAREDSFLIEGRFEPEAGDAVVQAGIPLNDDGRAVVSVRFGIDGRSQWYATGMVPSDPDLRINPPEININDLRGLLRAKGELVPAGSAKAPVVKAVEDLISKSPKTLEQKPFGSPPHAGFFEIVDFRTARDADAVMNAALRSLFVDLIKSNRYKELSTVEEKVTKVLQEKANELKEFVRRYRSDVRDVVARPHVDFSSGYRNVEIEITDVRGTSVPLSLRGDGFRAHLRLAAFEWSGEILAAAATRRRVFLLDEPDAHLDYLAQRRILGVIEEYARREQVLLATHSMNLVNRVALDRIVHFELDRGCGKSIPRSIQAEPGAEVAELNRIGDSLGIENAVLFYERCFFLFEGETELHAVPRLYEVWTGSKWYLDGVRFVNGYNNEGAVLFARFLHSNGRPVVALIDEDTTRNKGFQRQFSQSRLEGQALLPAERIKTIGPSCFELAFPSAAWYRAVYRATAGKKRVSKAKLDSVRDSARDFIRYLQTASGGLSKVQLGVALSSVATRREIPAQLGEAFDLAKEYAARCAPYNLH